MYKWRTLWQVFDYTTHRVLSELTSNRLKTLKHIDLTCNLMVITPRHLTTLSKSNTLFFNTFFTQVEISIPWKSRAKKNDHSSQLLIRLIKYSLWVISLLLINYFLWKETQVCVIKWKSLVFVERDFWSPRNLSR